MTTNRDKFTCGVCQELYTRPVLHKSCGFSFDRQCINNICPAEQCGKLINEEDLVVNHALIQVTDDDRLKVETPAAYYLVLLDTSSSMWYSDTWFPFATGESRFTYAKQFLTGFFNIHLNSPIDKISLVTFDTSELQRFNFATINSTHLTILQTLTCEGRDTALFDSIDVCLDKLEKLKEELQDEISASYLIIVTDGGNNFGKKESEQAVNVSWRSKKLDISGHIIQIGDTNRRKTRTICEAIKFKYNHFNGGNTKEFVKSFTETIKSETQAQVAKFRALVRSSAARSSAARSSAARSSAARSVTESALQFTIDQLPEVPKEPVRVKPTAKVLA